METMLNKLREGAQRRRASSLSDTAGDQLSLADSAADAALCPELPTPEAVLFVCLHEIGRQVSVTCEDRGRLLFAIRS